MPAEKDKGAAPGRKRGHADLDEAIARLVRHAVVDVDACATAKEAGCPAREDIDHVAALVDGGDGDLWTRPTLQRLGHAREAMRHRTCGFDGNCPAYPWTVTALRVFARMGLRP